jgi:hypothetical protein
MNEEKLNFQHVGLTQDGLIKNVEWLFTDHSLSEEEKIKKLLPMLFERFPQAKGIVTISGRVYDMDGEIGIREVITGSEISFKLGDKVIFDEQEMTVISVSEQSPTFIKGRPDPETITGHRQRLRLRDEDGNEYFPVSGGACQLSVRYV